MEPPRCFISYSWDSEEHREWVRHLANRLRECGVDALLDQFHCAPGTDLAEFMETSIRESAFVLLVCTPNFARRANAGIGGVGYEKSIVTGEIFAGEAQETKFVPVLRQGDQKKALPSYLKSRLFIDFREDGLFEAGLEELVRHFHGEPLHPPPPLGTKPDWNKPAASRPAKTPPLKKSIQNTIGMEFLLIPAGSFMMSSHLRPKEVARRFGGEASFYECERPQHEVTIGNAFYLQSTPVTQGQWKKVMGKNPSEFKKRGNDCPIESVSWEDAKIFIKTFKEMEFHGQYRLPTEAEWEYACRAGTATEFSFGDDASDLGEYAWYSDNSKNKTHPVATKKPNPWGLYDMHGNVWEWVEDDWHSSYMVAPTDSSAWIDRPRDYGRVIRGGSWLSVARDCRSARRDEYWSGRRLFNVGFRLARSINP